MIPFFRKLRRRFLAQDRFSRYLLYAVGEIVLVVIGILIALQVNNWNESRKENRQMRVNLRALQVDLERDSALIVEKLDWTRQDSTQLGKFRRIMSAPGVTRANIIPLARYEFSPWLNIAISFNNNTYRSLEATGELKAMPDTLQKELMQLNNSQQTYANTAISDMAIYLDQTILYSRNYPFADVGHIHPDSDLAGQIWDRADTEAHAADFNALIGVKYSIYYSHIPQLEAIQKSTLQLLAAVRKTLN